LSQRSSQKRHEEKPIDVTKLDLPETLEKFAPNTREVVSLLGEGRAETGGDIELKRDVIKYRRFPVAWGVPFDELGYSYWFINFMKLNFMPWDALIFAINTYLPEARSFIHEQFLTITTDAKFLVMLDSDVIPPPGAVAKLIARKLPLVGGWYPKKTHKEEDRKPVVYDFHGYVNGKPKWQIRDKPGKGLEEVGAAGAGFWVMRRDVAEAIGKRPYDFLKAGEDLEMCRKVKEAGFKIYIDWDLKAEHRGVFSV